MLSVNDHMYIYVVSYQYYIRPGLAKSERAEKWS